MNCRMFYVSDHSTEFVPSCASTGKSVAGPFFSAMNVNVIGGCRLFCSCEFVPVCMSQLLAMRSKI